jgi:hypothetical protein
LGCDRLVAHRNNRKAAARIATAAGQDVVCLCSLPVPYQHDLLHIGLPHYTPQDGFNLGFELDI